MSQGLPLPWPFPWRHEIATSTVAHCKFQLASEHAEKQISAAMPSSLTDLARAAAEVMRRKFGHDLPPTRMTQLYIVEAISEIKIPDPSDSSRTTTTPVVIYPPEFLIVLDVGLESLVGGSAIWKRPTYGYADPSFPIASEMTLRSVTTTEPHNLIFPKVAGSIMIGCQDGTAADDIMRELDRAHLREISISGTFVTASCKPFEEVAVCRQLEASLPFIKYAEPNGIVRLIDFSPGWIAKRIV
ncbi:MAG: hypothetical protein AB7O57_00245 [Hyphomicrobiaceae bacterium]